MRIKGKQRTIDQHQYKCDACGLPWWDFIQIAYHDCPHCGWVDPPEDIRRIGQFLRDDEI